MKLFRNKDNKMYYYTDAMPKDNEKNPDSDYCYNKMKRIFDEHVLPIMPSAIFSRYKVNVIEHLTRKTQCTYRDDKYNIKITYLRRETWCIDDYDWFEDIIVTINDEVILKKIKQ